MERIVAELAVRLGMGAEQIAAELERSNGSQKVLAHRLMAKYKRLCKDAEIQDKKDWNRTESDAAQLRHSQELALQRESLRRQRNALPIHKRIGRVLAEMTTLQEGTRAASYEARISGDKDGGIPKLAETPLLDRWNERFSRVVRLAEHELDVACGRTSATKSSGAERDKEILRATEGDPPTIAAEIVGWSESGIRKLRKRYELRARDGLKEAA